MLHFQLKRWIGFFCFSTYNEILTVRQDLRNEKMTDEQKLEYQEIRDEYSLLTQIISATINFSILGSIAIFSFIASRENLTFELFGLVLLIIYPSCYIIISRIQSILRLAAYIYVFIEPGCDIKFETRLLRFKTKTKLKFSKTVLWSFLGLIIINIGLFISNGYYSFWNISFYSISILIFGHIYYLMTRNWKKRYILSWEEVKRVESQI